MSALALIGRAALTSIYCVSSGKTVPLFIEVKLFACVCKLDLLQFVALFDNP